MSEEQAFLHEIMSQPDDDLPRMIYSDWLEDQGDPRALFIRVQCELAAIDEGDPRWTELQVQSELYRLEYGTEWARPVKQYSGKVEFVRGFPDHLTLHADVFIKHHEEIRRLTPMAHLKLLKLTSRVNDVAECEGLRFLRSLSLRSNALIRGRAGTLFESPYLENLTALDLSKTEFRDKEMLELLAAPSLGNLRSLNLTEIRDTKVLLRDFLSSDLCRQLEHLDVSEGWYYSYQPGLDLIGDIVSSPGIANLRSLRLEQQSIQADSTLAKIANSPYLQNLERLSLRDLYQAHGATLAPLVTATNMPKLKIWDLSRLRANQDALSHFCKSQSFPELRWLSMGNIWYGSQDPDLAKLSQAVWLSKLYGLHLPNTFLQNNGVKQFAEADLSELRLFDLANTGVTTKGVEALSKNETLTNLVSLDLSHNQISAGGLRAIARSPHLENLQRLTLRFSRVNETGLEALLKSKFLPKLCLIEIELNDSTKIGRRIRRQLRERFGHGVRITQSYY